MERYKIDGEYVYIPKEEPKRDDFYESDLLLARKLAAGDPQDSRHYIKITSIKCPVCKG